MEKEQAFIWTVLATFVSTFFVVLPLISPMFTAEATLTNAYYVGILMGITLTTLWLKVYLLWKE